MKVHEYAALTVAEAQKLSAGWRKDLTVTEADDTAALQQVHPDHPDFDELATFAAYLRQRPSEEEDRLALEEAAL